MDHGEAVRTQAVDKYLLGELDIERRDAFENHYFDCDVCAEDVRSGTLLLDNAAALKGEFGLRRVAAKEREKPSWFRLFLQPAFGLPVAALALLCAGLAYTTSDYKRQLDAALAPQPVSEVPVSQARGGEAASVTRGNRAFVVAFDLDRPIELSEYEAGISGSGVAPARVRLHAPDPGMPFRILLPTARYKAGSYELVIHGGGRELMKLPFTLKD